MKPTVKYIHLRYAPDEGENDNAPFSNMGGATLAYCFVESLKNDIVELRMALTVCSKVDNFCKQEGRTRATYRLEGHPNRWTHTVELSPDEIVQLSTIEIIQYAYEAWPRELDTWGIDADFNLELLAAKEAKLGTATRVQI